MIDSSNTQSWAPYDLPQLQQTTLISSSGQPYRIIVASPCGPPPPEGYPVIYLVDGNAWTALVSELIRVSKPFGIQTRIEPAVVVGIGYPSTSPFDLGRRKFDLTPLQTAGLPYDGRTRAQGGGDVALMDFLDTTVKPLIESRYTIDTDRQALLGHSLGGLFTLNTMLNRPCAFQSYVAISPSIWWNDGELLQRIKSFPREDSQDRPKSLRVFLAVGGLEQDFTPEYKARNRTVLLNSLERDIATEAEADEELADLQAKTMVTNTTKIVDILRKHGVQTNFSEFPDDDHMSVVMPALNKAISWVFDDNLPI